MCLCPNLFLKDTSPVGLGPIQITSFYFHDLLKCFISKYSHILRYWRLQDGGTIPLVTGRDRHPLTWEILMGIQEQPHRTLEDEWSFSDQAGVGWGDELCGSCSRGRRDHHRSAWGGRGRQGSPPCSRSRPWVPSTQPIFSLPEPPSGPTSAKRANAMHQATGYLSLVTQKGGLVCHLALSMES